MILTFGKHKDEEIENVFADDSRYCRWLYTQPILMGKFPEIHEFLDSKFKNTDLSYPLTFGKYKGLPINWIYNHDRKYFDWMAGNKFVSDNCPKLKEAIQSKLN